MGTPLGDGVKQLFFCEGYGGQGGQKGEDEANESSDSGPRNEAIVALNHGQPTAGEEVVGLDLYTAFQLSILTFSRSN